MASDVLARSEPLTVKIWGDYACFTRPEMKIERVSYPVMTPSAARGILEAIFWKPEFAWHIQEIEVLNPIRYFSIMRNEVKTRASHRTAQSWAKTGYGGYYADRDRTQRHTLAIRDVAYIVRAHMELHGGVYEDPAKYREQFRRRVSKGQCFATPYLGCREFWASFGPPDRQEEPLDLNMEIGPMLFDMNYEQNGTGRGTPMFFEATLERGVLHVPNRRELEDVA